MNKLLIGGLGAAMISVMASCGSVAVPNATEPVGSNVTFKYVLDGQEITQAAVDQLEATLETVYFRQVDQTDSAATVEVYTERTKLDSALKERLTPQYFAVCVFGAGETTTFYDLPSYSNNGSQETFDTSDDFRDLHDATEPGGGNWYMDFSSVKSGPCITTIMYKGLNFTGAAWVLDDGEDIANMGSWNNAVQSVELFK